MGQGSKHPFDVCLSEIFLLKMHGGISFKKPFITDRRDTATCSGPPPEYPSLFTSFIGCWYVFSLKMNLDALCGYQVTISYKAVFESVVPRSRGRTRPQFSPSLFASWLAVSSWHEAGVTERDGRAFLMGLTGRDTRHSHLRRSVNIFSLCFWPGGHFQ